MSINTTKTAEVQPIVLLDISLIETNEGQLEGVPTNPCLITEKEFSQLCKSIDETPQLIGPRPLIVYPHDDKYVVIGGNQRLRAFRHLGFSLVSAYVLPQDTPAETLRAMVIKDNKRSGDWDYDIMANEWDEIELSNWGIDIPTPSFIDDEEDIVTSSKKGNKLTLTFELSPSVLAKVYEALMVFDEDINVALLKALGISNNGK